MTSGTDKIEKPAKSRTTLQRRLHEIIFEAETPGGKFFDLVLILSIVVSVVVVMLDSVSRIRSEHGALLRLLEWSITILFTVEYALRIYCIGRPIRYMTSFFGVVDLLSILPTYLSLMVPGSRYLGVIRVLRLLRVFRVLKLAKYLGEGHLLMGALYASRRKLEIFIFGVLTLVIIIGSIMYVIEGEENGFTSIPRAVYWAIVTLTTVGYGDISPQTNLGQALAAVVMLLGYSIIAVPTGLITAELTAMQRQKVTSESCPQCSAEGHESDALYCKFCGARL